MDKTKLCGKCDEEYHQYLVFLKDDEDSLADFARIKDEYGQVCQDCREDESNLDDYLVSEYDTDLHDV